MYRTGHRGFLKLCLKLALNKLKQWSYVSASFPPYVVTELFL